MTTTSSFLVVDDEERVTRGLARVMRTVRPCVVAHNASEAEPLLVDTSRRWCGFLFDLMLGDRTGVELLELARMRHPSVPALIISGHDAASAPNRAYALGSAFVSKPIGRLELQRFFAEAIAFDAGLSASVRALIVEVANQNKLTPAETEVFAMAMLHEPAARIVEQRGVSENTHKTQVRSLLKKLNAPSLDEACRRVLKG